jgi:hypothetical protein
VAAGQENLAHRATQSALGGFMAVTGGGVVRGSWAVGEQCATHPRHHGMSFTTQHHSPVPSRHPERSGAESKDRVAKPNYADSELNRSANCKPVLRLHPYGVPLRMTGGGGAKGRMCSRAVSEAIFLTTSKVFPATSKTFPATSNVFPVTSKAFPTTSKTFLATSKTFPVTSNVFPATGIPTQQSIQTVS